jgi:DNA-binding transcriptional LysR family regulator
MARVGILVQAEIERRQIAVRSTMEIDNLEGVVAMVAAGLGASVVPTRGVAGEFPSSIRTLPFGRPPLTRRLGLLVPLENPRSHLSRLLLDALCAATGQGHLARGLAA